MPASPPQSAPEPAQGQRAPWPAGLKGGISSAIAQWGQRLRRPSIQTLPWLVLALGLGLTAAVCEGKRLQGRAEHERIERDLAEDITSAIEAKFTSTQAVLSAVVGLFNSSVDVTSPEFQQFYRSLSISPSTLSGVQGVGYAAVIPPGGIPALEAQARKQGLQDFRVRPAGNRPLTSAILFLEPLDWRNQRAIGFDMYSEPTRREAMQWAASTGGPALSGPVKLMQEAGKRVQPGSLLYLPIYRQEPRSEADRLRHLQGWAYAPLRMDDLLRSTLASIQNPTLARSAVLIFDGSKPLASALLFDSQRVHGTRRLQHPSWQTLRVVNRDWLIGIQLPPDQISPNGFSSTLVISGLLGIAISLAAALGLRTLVDSQLRLQRALQLADRASREQALATTVFENSPVAIVVTDANGFVLASNEAFTQISGYSRQHAHGRKTNLLKSGQHDEAFYRDLWDSVIQQGHWHGEIWNRHCNGQLRRHELSINAVLDKNLQITNFVGMLRDITARHEEQEAVRHQATHDYLTGLPNRALLMEQLAQALAMARRYQHQVAVMFMDINGFKPVNDTHGHGVGDQLLQLVANRLREKLRESDILCRQGGDEFVLLIPQAPELPQLMALAQTLRDAVAQPYPELPGSVAVSLSIGIAHWPKHALDADGLLNAADAAMYRAKHGEAGFIDVAPELPLPPG